MFFKLNEHLNQGHGSYIFEKLIASVLLLHFLPVWLLPYSLLQRLSVPSVLSAPSPDPNP